MLRLALRVVQEAAGSDAFFEASRGISTTLLQRVAQSASTVIHEPAESGREKESHRGRARSMLETARDHQAAKDSFRRVARKFLEDLQP